MNRRTLRRTLWGAAVGAGLFGGGAVYQSVASGGELSRFLGPTAFMMALGATVGGLAGPLVGEALARWKISRRQAVETETSTERVSGQQQPLWINLLAGLAVGWAVGTSWDAVWGGIALGLGLALAARAVFR